MLIGFLEHLDILDIPPMEQLVSSSLTPEPENRLDTPSGSRTSLVTAGNSVILTRSDCSEWATLGASPSSSGPDGRGEHDVGTKTMTSEEDKVSAAAFLVQTDLPVLKAQLPHLDVAHAHIDHPSVPVSAQVSPRDRILARWGAAAWKAVPPTVVCRSHRLCGGREREGLPVPKERALTTGSGLNGKSTVCFGTLVSSAFRCRPSVLT